MISVQNRLPEPGKENRVSITPDSGEPIEGVLAYADNASQQGTFWNRSTAQLLQGDIRTYPVRDGQSISAGDVVNVGREILSGTTYGDLAVGSTVQINENGSPVNYLVVHQGNPDPNLYDASCDGTWLLRKDIAEERVWDAGSSNQLATSDIHAYLNGDWLNRYESATLSSIKSVKVPYCIGGNSSTVNSGQNGLHCKAFLLSAYEVGYVYNGDNNVHVDGSKLSYFESGSEASAKNKRISALNGNTTSWWLRSPYTKYQDEVNNINSQGAFTVYNVHRSEGVRPCIIMDSSVFVDTPAYDEKTVYRDVTPQANVENVLKSGSVTDSCTVNIDTDSNVVGFKRDYNVTMYLVDNEGTKKTTSSFTAFSLTNAVSSLGASVLKQNIFVTYCISLTNLYAKISTVSGTSITFGSQYTVASSVSNNAEIIALSETLALSIYNSSGLKCKVLPISGTTITTSGTVYSLSGNTGANYISACKLPDDASGNKRVCICFSDTGDSNKGKAVIATIDSSNVVTFGSLLTFSSYNTLCTSCDILGNDIIVAYTADADGQKLLVCSIPLEDNDIMGVSETFTVGTATSIFFSLNVLAGKIVVLYTNIKGISIILDRNDDSFALKSSFDINDSAIPYVSSSVISNNKIISVYADNGNSNYGTTTILEVLDNQIAGSFIDESKDAIALADGTGGQSIPVGFGGYCECPGVTEGDTIDSSGVSAVAVQDGWLLIKDAWSKGYVTGEYSGTDQGYWSIDVGFKPSVLLIQEVGFYASGGYSTCQYIAFIKGCPYGGVFNEINTTLNVTFTNTGLSFNGYIFNKSDCTYYYVAWR